MKRIVSKVRRQAQGAADLAYWLSRPMAERVAAVEVLRIQAESPSGQDHAEPRLQRVCRVSHRQRG